MAAAGSDHHVAVLFEDNVGAVIKVEDRDAMELGRRTAGLGHRPWVDKVYLLLDEAEISPHKQWKRAYMLSGLAVWNVPEFAQ